MTFRLDIKDDEYTSLLRLDREIDASIVTLGGDVLTGNTQCTTMVWHRINNKATSLRVIHQCYEEEIEDRLKPMDVEILPL